MLKFLKFKDYSNRVKSGLFEHHWGEFKRATKGWVNVGPDNQPLFTGILTLTRADGTEVYFEYEKIIGVKGRLVNKIYTFFNPQNL